MEQQNRIEQDVHEIKNKVASMAMEMQLMHKIHESLVGNDISKDGGLVERVIKNENKIEILEGRIEDVEKKEDQKQLYVKIIIGFGASLLTLIATLIVKFYLK